MKKSKFNVSVAMLSTLLLSQSVFAGPCDGYEAYIDVARERAIEEHDNSIYTDAKREYLACKNTETSIQHGTGYDIGRFLYQHELNDGDIQEELYGNEMPDIDIEEHEAYRY